MNIGIKKKVSIILRTIVEFLLVLGLARVSIAASTELATYVISGSGNSVSFSDLKARYSIDSIEMKENSNLYALEAAKYDFLLEALNTMAPGSDQYVETKLQVDLLKFAKDYQVSLATIANKKIESVLVKNCYQMILNQEQRDYYNANLEYLNIVYYIANKKYEKGYVTSETVDKIKSEMEENNAIIVENQFERDILALDTQIGVNAILMPISLQDKIFYEASTISLFKSRDYQRQQLQNTITAYENYLINSNFLVDSPSYRKIMLQITDYQLQMQKLDISMEKFAKRAMKGYNIASRKCSNSRYKVSIAAKEYSDAQMQFRKGKIAKIDLYKVQVSKEEKEVEYYKYCYQKMVWEYIIENGIYGITP